jgi:hypothetical protein
MHSLVIYTIKRNILAIILLTILMAVIIISSSLELYASASGVDFFSLSSAPGGVRSLETLIAKWWNWWVAQPVKTATNWPPCIKGDGGTIGNNQSVVFLANSANAVEENVNARNQKCEVSSSQLLYLNVYSAEISTGSKPHEGEIPDIKSPADLLKLAKEANEVIKLMQVKVDGKDVSSNIIRQSTSQPFNFIVPSDNAFDWKAPIVGGNNTSMAEQYYLLFKPLPVGDHTIELEVIRQPRQSNQPVEHPVAKWDIKVVP